MSALREDPIGTDEIYEAFARTMVERLRYLDAFSNADHDARREQEAASTWRRLAQERREVISTLTEAYDAQAQTIEKLERKLAKAKRRNRGDS